MKLDPNADFIEVYADWHTKGIPSKTHYQKAMQDVSKGVAEITSPTSIKLLVREGPLRERILKRDKNICQYCGKYGDTIDHISPRSKYGYTSDENCVCACYRCNQLKKDKPFHVFIKDLVKEELLEIVKRLD